MLTWFKRGLIDVERLRTVDRVLVSFLDGLLQVLWLSLYCHEGFAFSFWQRFFLVFGVSCGWVGLEVGALILGFRFDDLADL